VAATMKALVKSKPGLDGLNLEQVPIPVPQKGQLLVKVKACAICGTDLHIQYDEYISYPPVILGHEFFGEIVEMGQDVTGFELGEHVAAMTATSTCGQCPACKSGFLMRCAKRRSVGSGFNGAMAEYIAIPAAISYKIPQDKWDDLSMAICEPLSCAAHLVFNRAEVKAGDIAVVLGPGVLGLATIQLLKLQGAFVIASGTPVDLERLELAKEMGADEIVSEPSMLKETVLKFASLGADVVYECSGAGSALASAVDICKRGGYIGQLGMFGKPITLDIDQLLIKEVNLNTSFATSCSSWEKLMRLFEQNKVMTKQLVSTILPLEDWEKGFSMARNKEGYRIVLLPDASVAK
jgi:L-iditol 2-dehydrogenase